MSKHEKNTDRVILKAKNVLFLARYPTEISFWKFTEHDRFSYLNTYYTSIKSKSLKKIVKVKKENTKQEIYYFKSLSK